jgi:4-amino-4-deoxy-L-arabinose transferase-like glycosyltransferase
VSKDSKFIDVAISFLLVVGIATLLASGLKAFGLTWDEGVYFRAGSSYLSWFRHPSLNTLDSVWIENHEHPPAHKVVAGFTEWLFHDVLQISDRITGYRVSSLVFAGLTVWSLYWLTLSLFGRAEAVLASLILFLLPRVFYDGHLLTLDLSAMALWTCLTAVVWQGWKQQAELSVRLGLFAGLALLAKINAPFALFSRYALFLKQYWLSERTSVPQRIIVAREMKLAGVVFMTSVVVFVAGWPWLWTRPLPRILEFIQFHRQHWLVPVAYLGNIYSVPPWHYPYVLLFFTTPAILFVLLCVGTILLGLKWREDRAFFVLVNMFIPILLVQMSQAKYNGVRLFLPSFPFIAIIAAVAVVTTCRTIKAHGTSQGVLLAGSAALVLYLGHQNRRYYPYTDSYFSEWIGGIKGADKIGSEVQYWCNSSLGLLDWMERHKTHRFWANDCGPIFSEYFIHSGIAWRPQMTLSADQADYWILFNSAAHLGGAYEAKVRTATPAMSIEVEGVRLVGIYDRQGVSQFLTDEGPTGK